MTTPDLVVAGELALLAVGAGLLILLHRRGRLAAWLALPDRLPAWPIGGWDFLLFAFLVVVLSSVGPLAALKALEAAGAAEAPLRREAVAAFAFHAALLGAWLLFRIHPAGTPPPSGAAAGPAIRTGALACLLGLPVLMLAVFAAQRILETFGAAPESQPMVGLLRRSEPSPELVALALLPVVVTPLTEELVFRAGIFRFFATRMPGTWAAVLSSVVFALQHDNALAFGPLALLGVLLCAVYQKTGHLAAPILLHALFNLNSVVLTLFGPEP